MTAPTATTDTPKKPRKMTYRPKQCPPPCGVTFTPTGGKQVFHNRVDCPAFQEYQATVGADRNGKHVNGNGAAPAAPKKRRSRAKRAAPAQQRRELKVPPAPEPSNLLDRLIADCDQNLERINGEAAPLEVEAADLAARLATLKGERREVERIRSALAKSAT